MEQMGNETLAPDRVDESPCRTESLAEPLPVDWMEGRSLLARWLACGLFWLPVGMAVSPGNHPRGVYHWTLALLLFIPALGAMGRRRAELARTWLTHWPLQLCLSVLVWAGITLCWATGPQLLERLKAPIFVLLYLSAWLAWSRGRRREEVRALFFWSAIALAAAALAAMIAFPWRDIVWHHRMIGLALLDGPNLSAYVMAGAFLWLVQLAPASGMRRYLCGAAMLILLVFVAWTGSRGSWAALVASLIAMALCGRDRLARGLAVGAIVALLVLLLAVPTELTHRGLSYRPQIFRQALAYIGAHPWGGLGLGSDYRVTAGRQVLTHSHNLFTNVGIEVGLPGLVLWLSLWAWMGWQGWHHRNLPLGRILLSVWVFASVALQVDGPSFLQSPRPEWLVTWMPLALALQLWLENHDSRASRNGAP